MTSTKGRPDLGGDDVLDQILGDTADGDTKPVLRSKPEQDHPADRAEAVDELRKYAQQTGIPSSFAGRGAGGSPSQHEQPSAKRVNKDVKKETFSLPAYVAQQLDDMHHDTREPKKAIVLRGLREIGIHVDEEDLRDNRKKIR